MRSIATKGALRLSIWMIVGLLSASAQNRPTDPATRVAELFDNGQSAHERGDLTGAVRLYSEALMIDGLFWQAEYQRALAWRSLRQMAEAGKGMRRTIELLSDYEETPEGKTMLSRAWQSLAEIQSAQQDYAGAEESYQKLVKLSVGDRQLTGRWQAALAALYLERGQIGECLKAVVAAMDSGDRRPRTMAIRGVALCQTGEQEEGLKWLNESIGLDADEMMARRQRAEIYLQRRDLKAGIADLQVVVRKHPDLQARLRLAWAYAGNRQSDEALEIYRKVLEEDPSNNEARVAVAALTIETGSSEEAIAQLEGLIKADEKRADLRAQLAELLIRNQPERALEQYLIAARLEPARVSHRVGVGTALVRLRRMAEAVGVLRTALDMSPGEDIAYYLHTNLGTALFELNDFAAAIPEFTWILEHQTDEKRIPITLYFLGICYDRTGEYEEALKIYEQFLTKATNVNQLEIEKVQLRLPVIKKQIKDGKGKRKR
jgi:tetratricopeptide (TPR) repeat protein